jgi:recombinational DNA repair protein RecR
MERFEGEGFEVISPPIPPWKEGHSPYLTDLIRSLRSGDKDRLWNPHGGEIEYADGMTLSKALEGRREI